MENRKQVYIKTFGCQMNSYDSEIMAGVLNSQGYQITKNQVKADSGAAKSD
ncbi:MAG: hypothetical protein ABIJ24_02430 [Nitrospinota bacterium]|nr:hypothetical protein [Nitrospinota bacterium]